MKGNGRTFTLSTTKAVRVPRRLMLEITGATGAGKTKSALELATGMQRVIGGDIRLVDTDSARASLYAEKYDFYRDDFVAPFSPLDYLAMFQACEKSGAAIVVVDQMSYEHNGPGGLLDMHEAEVARGAGLPWTKPKAARRVLKDWILASKMSFVFCYRAAEKMKWEKGKAPEPMGWKEDSTSDLPFEMDARFLLEPGADGKPTFYPENKFERARTKNPEYFREWFKEGMVLNADLGEKMMRWAQMGGGGAASKANAPADAPTVVGLPAGWTFPGGVHKGKRIADAPTDYLADLLAGKLKDPNAIKTVGDELAARKRRDAGEVDDVPPPTDYDEAPPGND